MAYVALGDSLKRVMQKSREYPDSYTILYTAMGTNEDLQKAKAMFSNYSFTNDITIMKDGGGVRKEMENLKNIKIKQAIKDIVTYATLPPQIDYVLPYKIKSNKAEEYLMSLPYGEKHIARAEKQIEQYYSEKGAGQYDKLFDNGGKIKNGGNLVFSPVAVEKANIEELFEMAEEIGLKNYHNLNKEFLRKKILQKFNVEFKTGGVGKQKVYVDLFEDYENIPKKVQEIVDEYGENFGGDGSEMDYQDTANMLKDVEAVGYTFSYGLDNEPFGLRPIGVRLNQLRDYEDLDDDDYAEGGGVGSEWTVTIIYPSDNKKSGWISNDSIDIKVLANSYESAKQKAMNKFKKIHSGKKGTVTSVNSNTHKFLDNAKLSKGSTVKGGKFNINGNYLDNISNDKKNEILKNIANHYGISLKDAEEEVKDADAEMLYDYIANDKSLKMEIYNHFEKSGIGKIAFPIKDKMANGGGIDINELNIPVIRTQFEDEEYEFKDGGNVDSDIAKYKKQLIAKAKSKGLYENFGQKELKN